MLKTLNFQVRSLAGCAAADAGRIAALDEGEEPEASRDGAGDGASAPNVRSRWQQT